MHPFQIDPSLMPPVPGDRIPDLCWTAREILGAYMEEACDFGEDDDNEQLPYGGGENGLAIHETAAVRINARQEVSLSNMPFLVDPDGAFVPATEPGYIALRAEPIGHDPAEQVLEPGKDSHQIFFRLHTPSDHTAAIFDGYSLDDEAKIQNRESARLKRIERTLVYVRYSLRTLMQTDAAGYSAMYHSRAPRASTAELVEQGLRDFLGE